MAAPTTKETGMRRTGLMAALAAAALAGCAGMMGGGGGWTPLVDNGKGLERFERVGQANWGLVDGALQATSGGSTPAYLVTRDSYRDFTLRAEFWASDDANSGVFVRCQNPQQITDESCYEANIFDQRPDPTYGTGSIVKVAPVRQPPPKAGGRWNTLEMTARGDHLVVMLNGEKTVDHRDRKFASGPIALQWGRGTVKFRNVQIKPL
jgi:hypothetical protein